MYINCLSKEFFFLLWMCGLSPLAIRLIAQYLILCEAGNAAEVEDSRLLAFATTKHCVLIGFMLFNVTFSNRIIVSPLPAATANCAHSWLRHRTLLAGTTKVHRCKIYPNFTVTLNSHVVMSSGYSIGSVDQTRLGNACSLLWPHYSVISIQSSWK